MEFINGPSVKDFLNDESSFLQNRESDVKNLAHSIGVILWKMHQATIIHGDLTTSNLILRDLYDTSSVVRHEFIFFLRLIEIGSYRLWSFFDLLVRRG